MPEQWKQLDGEGASNDARPRADGQFLAETIAGIAAAGNLDLDERSGNGGAPRGAAHQRCDVATGTTYTLNVENEGLKDKGVAAEDVTISLILPPGTKAVSATGNGYQGTKGDEKANADVAVWRLRNWRRTNIRTSRLPSRELLRATRFQEERWPTRNPRPRLTRS